MTSKAAVTSSTSTLFVSKDHSAGVEGTSRAYETASHTLTFAVTSHAGMEDTPDGIMLKTNQDSWALATNWHVPGGHSYFAICDGHGEFGDAVSQFTTGYLAKTLTNGLTFHSDLTKSALRRIFLDCDDELKKVLDCSFSGSTAVLALLHNHHLTVAWLGDSRAILGTVDKSGNLGVHSVTHDHKPSVLGERERILASGGRVEPVTVDGSFRGPERVWHANGNAPGLTMTRAWGDTWACQVGVIADPDACSMDLGPEHKYLVLCSDGIVEFMENEEVMRRVHAAHKLGKQPHAIADELVHEAQARWRTREGTVDDCTVIVIFLDFKSDFKGGISRGARGNFSRMSLGNLPTSPFEKYSPATLAALTGRGSFQQRRSLDDGNGNGRISATDVASHSLQHGALTSIPSSKAKAQSSEPQMAVVDRSAVSAAASSGRGSGLGSVGPGVSADRMKGIFVAHKKAPSCDAAGLSGFSGEYTALRQAALNGAGGSRKSRMSGSKGSPFISATSSFTDPAHPRPPQLVHSHGTDSQGKRSSTHAIATAALPPVPR